MEVHLPRVACLEILTYPLGVLKNGGTSDRKFQKFVRLQRLLRAAFQSCGVVCAQSRARFSPQVWLAAATGVNPPELVEVIEIRLACFGGASLGDTSCGNRPGYLVPAANNNEIAVALLCHGASGSFCPLILFFWVGRCW